MLDKYIHVVKVLKRTPRFVSNIFIVGFFSNWIYIKPFKPFGILEIGLLELSVRQNETRNSDFVSLQKLGVQKEVMIACKHR